MGDEKFVASEKFKALCEIAGLTYNQMMTCESISVTCNGFGFVKVDVSYVATGDIEND